MCQPSRLPLVPLKDIRPWPLSQMPSLSPSARGPTVFHHHSSRLLQPPMCRRLRTRSRQATVSRVGCRPLKSTPREPVVHNYCPSRGHSPVKPRLGRSACPKPTPTRSLGGLAVREWRLPTTHLPFRNIMTNSVSISFALISWGFVTLNEVSLTTARTRVRRTSRSR